MFTLMIPFFSIMVALLRRLLPAPHRDVFAVGAISTLVSTEVAIWFWVDWHCMGTGLIRRSRALWWTWQFFWSGTDRIDNHDNGAGYTIGTARSGRNTS